MKSSNTYAIFLFPEITLKLSVCLVFPRIYIGTSERSELVNTMLRDKNTTIILQININNCINTLYYLRVLIVTAFVIAPLITMIIFKVFLMLRQSQLRLLEFLVQIYITVYVIRIIYLLICYRKIVEIIILKVAF